jgi:hypothetical protein
MKIFSDSLIYMGKQIQPEILYKTELGDPSKLGVSNCFEIKGLANTFGLCVTNNKPSINWLEEINKQYCLLDLDLVSYFKYMEQINRVGFNNRLPVDNFGQVANEVLDQIASKNSKLLVCKSILEKTV